MRFLAAWFFLAYFFSGAALAEQSKSTSSILATVNGVAITEAEVDRALSLAMKHNEKLRVTEKLKKDVLDELIALTLIEQRLAQTGVLKNPAVQDEIEFSRRSTLKNIFMAQVVGQKTDIKIEDVDRFAAEHPEFFAGRKTYYYTDLKITREPRVDVSRVKGFALSSNSKTVEQNKATGGAATLILGYLRAVGGDVSSFRGYRSSEQIDPGLLNDLSSLEPGKFVVNDTAEKGFIHVLELYSVQPDPIDPVQARSQIAQGIATQRAKKTVDDMLAKMRSDADVKFGVEAAKTAKRKPPSATVVSKPSAFDYEHPIPISVKVALAWTAALLVLLPTTLLRFHRQTVAQRAQLYLVDQDTVSLIRNRMTLFSYTPIFEVFFGIAVSGAMIVTSSSIFSMNFSSPDWRESLFLLTAGLATGLALCFALFRYREWIPTLIRSSRWLPLGLVTLTQALIIVLTLDT